MYSIDTYFECETQKQILIQAFSKLASRYVLWFEKVEKAKATEDANE